MYEKDCKHYMHKIKFILQFKPFLKLHFNLRNNDMEIIVSFSFIYIYSFPHPQVRGRLLGPTMIPT